MATGFPPFATNHDLNVQFYFRFTELSHGIRRAGSAALDLCCVAAGRFEGFWELKLNPWDKAAGTLLVTEAGGRVTDVRGGAFNLLGDDVFVSNGLVHDEMLEVFAADPRAADPVAGAPTGSVLQELRLGGLFLLLDRLDGHAPDDIRNIAVEGKPLQVPVVHPAQSEAW